MRWKYLSIIIFLIILSSSTAAQSTIILEPIQDRITPDETALFTISITNLYQQTQRYTNFYTPTPGWFIDTKPLENRVLIINPQQTKSTEITVEPTADFSPGIYEVLLKISPDFDPLYSTKLKIYIKPREPLRYLPAIKATVDLDDKIDPRQTQSLKLFLENQNILNLEDLTIRIQSDIPEFNVQQRIDLPPLGKKTIEFTIQPNPLQQPKQYYLYFLFERAGETIKIMDKRIEILALTPPFTQQIDEEKSFLLTKKTATITNTGNVKNTQTVKIETTFFGSLFTSTSPPSKKIKENGQRYLAWNLELRPNQKTTLAITENFRFPFYLFIIIIILLALYFTYRSPLNLTKSASHVILHEGGISGLKVTLLLKNISRKPIKDITIIDAVPVITDIEKEIEMGTLKPFKTFRSRRGTIIKWKISEIEPKEERFITYKIKSRLNIIGGFKLPRAKALFLKHGKEKVAYSNTFRIGG